MIEDVAEALGRWTYLLVAALAFLETGAFVGLVAPGEFTVILGGVIAGQGEINVWCCWRSRGSPRSSATRRASCSGRVSGAASWRGTAPG